ncbi:SAV_2336 N-terminal domain-related protein [Streptomyces sp. NPDC002688]|uniref:SAV_2336 N-terminal domain-related protein n=1 Tax=Streptomyces sp. NPDC002688 TaxID=3154423 RepID=UPI003326464D
MDEELALSLKRLAGEPGASAEDLADILWVARYSGATRSAGEADGSDEAEPSAEETPQPTQRPSVAAPLDGPGPERPALPLHATSPAGRESPSSSVDRLDGSAVAPAVPGNHEKSPRELRALARALRPLKHRIRSSSERQLDEERTAQAAGETSLLLPTWESGKQRHFDVDLVVDTGPSMVIWRQLAADLRALLERCGAFHSVRTLFLDTSDTSPRLSWSHRVPQGARRSIAPERLADQTGRRLIFLLTDGVGPQWKSPALDATLHRWSLTQPVAVLQVLPHRLWHRTCLTTEPVSARSAALGGIPRYRSRVPGPGHPTRAAWVPVIELAPDWMEPWAKVVAGTAHGSTPMLALPVGQGASYRVDDNDRRSLAAHRGIESTDTADMLVERFRGEASVSAFELVGYLAAAPLVPPVMRLVQDVMMPRSTSAHLAEIFLSGLIVPAQDHVGPGDDPDLFLYDFRPGVREVLLGTLTRRESLRVLDEIGSVSGKVARRFGGSLSFRALVPSADTDGDWRIPAGSAPFARVAAGVLASLGEEQKVLAEALTAAAAAPAAEQPVAMAPVDADALQRSDPAERGGSREERLVALARAATVSVHRDETGESLIGSGSFVAPNWVLTSAHVVRGDAHDPTGRTRAPVKIGYEGRLLDGMVEWAQPEAEFGDESASGLALIRLSHPLDHPCVWLTDREHEFLFERAAYFGHAQHQGKVLDVSGSCTLRGLSGTDGRLLLGSGAEPEHGAAGGLVVDLTSGEVVGILNASRRDGKASTVVSVTQLRRIPQPVTHSGEEDNLYQSVVNAHDRYHADCLRTPFPQHDSWGDVLQGTWTDGPALTSHQRIELLGLLAELPPPVSTASLERIVQELGARRWYSLAPRAWRDGLGLLYDLPGDARLESVLRYAMRALEEQQRYLPTSTEKKLWQWIREAADGLSLDFRRELGHQRVAMLAMRELPTTPAAHDAIDARRAVVLEIVPTAWERDRCDWNVHVEVASNEVLTIAAGERAAMDRLPAILDAPLSEAFRRCDHPGRPAALEVAVPAPLLSLDVDAWRLHASWERALGATRPVVTRCTEDLRSTEDFWGKDRLWDEPADLVAERRARWRWLHTSRLTPEVLDCENGLRLAGPDRAHLRALPYGAIPILCCADSTWLHALVYAGHPIILWRRHRRPDLCGEFHRNARRAVETAATAAELPGAVFKLRTDLEAGRAEAYWADQLMIMYGDPTSELPGTGVLLEAP